MLTINPESIGFKQGDCVLDLGCGEGRHTLGLYFHEPLTALRPQVRWVGLDLNFSDLSTAKKRLLDFVPDSSPDHPPLFLQGNGLRLPFADHCFDHVICSEVLEHIHDYPIMLAEIVRVLKPEGGLYVSVPRAWPEKICWTLEKAYYEVEGGHVRIFQAEKLRNEIKNLGFEFLAHHGAHAIHVPYWWLRCLFWSRGEKFWPIRAYHKFLVWDLFSAPWLTRTLDKWLNPFMGKSVVMYFKKADS